MVARRTAQSNVLIEGVIGAGQCGGRAGVLRCRFDLSELFQFGGANHSPAVRVFPAGRKRPKCTMTSPELVNLSRV